MTAVALEATRIRVRSSTLLAGGIVVLATVVAWWASVPYVVGVWHDDGVYALLGRAIASGHGFHYTQFPGAPAATHYPPIYPLLLAAVWRLAPSFPDNISAFLALNAMLVGVATLGAYRFTRQRLGWRDDAAAAFALAATLSTPVLALSGAVLSESLFLAALWPVLSVAERAAAPGSGRRDAVVAGAAAGALMLVRTHAAALVLALALVLVARRRPRLALYAIAAAALVVMPWQLWTMLASPRVPAPLEGAYGSYLGWFIDGLREGGPAMLAATARLNLTELWLLVQDRVIPADVALPRMLAATLLLALGGVGIRAMWHRAAVMAWFVILYLAIVVVWPYAPWRFLWAIWPLVLVCAGAGTCRLWASVRTPWSRALVTAAVALPVVGMTRTEWHAYAGRTWSTPALQAGAQITPVVAWVGRHTRPSDVVLAEGEQVISLFTGRRAAPTATFTALEYVRPRTPREGASQMSVLLRAVPATYVLPLAPQQLEAARSLRGAKPGLRAIDSLPHGLVFAVER